MQTLAGCGVALPTRTPSRPLPLLSATSPAVPFQLVSSSRQSPTGSGRVTAGVPLNVTTNQPMSALSRAELRRMSILAADSPRVAEASPMMSSKL